MKHIKTYENNFIPIPFHDDNVRLYYKIYTLKDINRFNIILDKLKIRNDFYREYNDIKYVKNILNKSKSTYLLVDKFDNQLVVELLNDVTNWMINNADSFYDRDFGGDIFLSDYEMTSNKYNL